MKLNYPKQFALLLGKPILMHTIAKFYGYDNEMGIIVTLPENSIEQWQELCLKYKFDIPHKIVAGGKTRYHSIKNALNAIPEKASLIAVHDGVRPLLSTNLIRATFSEAEQYGSAIPVMPLSFSVRQILPDGQSVSIDRSLYREVQTPQIFKSEIIRDAYSLDYEQSITDDASLVEKAGYKIHLTEGEANNIKITQPSDIIMAEAILKSEA